jgi:hypothetical protein
MESEAFNMLFRHELKKLALSPVIIGFLAMFIAINTLLILSSYKIADYQNRNSTKLENIFEHFQTAEIADGYISKYDVKGVYAENIRSKYSKLQPVVDEKATNGDALSVYFGDYTRELHRLLFKTLFMAIIAEICLLALFLSLLSVTYEQMRGTESVIYASATGRRLLLVKLSASLAAAAAGAAIIISTGLFVFFLRFDFSLVWTDNVSSLFNTAANELGKPFITWRSFTVSGYLWATIGASSGLALCFCLLGYAMGTAVRNVYAAFIAALSTLGSLYLIKPLLPVGSVLRGIWNLTPVWLWKNSAMWFTDGAADILWANFELVGLFASFIVIAAASWLATNHFKRRELH